VKHCLYLSDNECVLIDLTIVERFSVRWKECV